MTVLRQTSRTARRKLSRRCWLCENRILRGDEYTEQSVADDTVCSVICHDICFAEMGRDGAEYGEFAETEADMPEAWRKWYWSRTRLRRFAE